MLNAHLQVKQFTSEFLKYMQSRSIFDTATDDLVLEKIKFSYAASFVQIF